MEDVEFYVQELSVIGYDVSQLTIKAALNILKDLDIDSLLDGYDNLSDCGKKFSMENWNFYRELKDLVTKRQEDSEKDFSLRENEEELLLHLLRE